MRGEEGEWEGERTERRRRERMSALWRGRVEWGLRMAAVRKVKSAGVGASAAEGGDGAVKAEADGKQFFARCGRELDSVGGQD